MSTKRELLLELKKYQVLGSPKYIREKFKILEGYEYYGSKDQLDTLLGLGKSKQEKLEEFEKLGTPLGLKIMINEFELIKSIFKMYQDIGTVKEIEDALDIADEIIKGYRKFGSAQQIADFMRNVHASRSVDTKINTFLYNCKEPMWDTLNEKSLNG